MFAGLAPAWRLAFDEAWASFQAGNFGVGAVLVDPVDGAVVSVGRNRVTEQHVLPGVLSGNMTAHAEMNAFAALDRFNAEGLHLYTTLEPCLMCAAAAMQLKVEHVHFGAVDEFYGGMDDLWGHHPLTALRRPASTGPLMGPLAQLARLLPMTFTIHHFPGRSGERLARRHHPDLAALVDRLLDDGPFLETTRATTLDEALTLLASDLGE